jgi:hypothetical protein
MRLYPDLPRRRAATLAGDVAVLLLVLLFAWLGGLVHDRVDELGALGRGVSDTGRSVEGGLGRAAGAVQDVPLVGGQVAGALRDAGRGTGGRAVAAGEEGERTARELADLAGWLTFGIPALLLLSRVLPPRIAQVRAMTAAERIVGAGDDPQRRALLAQRAAFGLPYGTLVRHTRDPLGDLAAGRLDALVAAAREDAGLRPHG